MEGQPVSILLAEHNREDVQFIVTTFALMDFLREVRIEDVEDGTQLFDFLFSHEVAHNTPNLILIDAFLPKTDVSDAIHQIRTHEQTRAIPVVVLGDVHQLHEDGSLYLEKPLNTAKLTALVKKLLST